MTSVRVMLLVALMVAKNQGQPVTGSNEAGDRTIECLVQGYLQRPTNKGCHDYLAMLRTKEFQEEDPTIWSQRNEADLRDMVLQALQGRTTRYQLQRLTDDFNKRNKLKILRL